MGKTAVGIDLGTTFSALAAINPAGKPHCSYPNSTTSAIATSASPTSNPH